VVVFIVLTLTKKIPEPLLIGAAGIIGLFLRGNISCAGIRHMPSSHLSAPSFAHFGKGGKESKLLSVLAFAIALFCKTHTTTRRFSACPSAVLSLKVTFCGKAVYSPRIPEFSKRGPSGNREGRIHVAAIVSPEQTPAASSWSAIRRESTWSYSRHVGHLNREALKSPRRALYGQIKRKHS
jgi:hypothetical protein